jgi:hypothetical protein
MPSNLIFIAFYFCLSKRMFFVYPNKLSPLTYLQLSLRKLMPRNVSLLRERIVQLLTPDVRLNTRRFVHGKGTDHEQATIPTFLMVSNTFTRPRAMYPQREAQPQLGVQQHQKVSVASDSDKVLTLWVSPLANLAHFTAFADTPVCAGLVDHRVSQVFFSLAESCAACINTCIVPKLIFIIEQILFHRVFM